MIEKNHFINLIIIHLLIELLLTLISSINIELLIISLLINVIIILKENNKCDIINSNYISSIIFQLFHYFVFTLSYAEILPWETFIVIILIIFIIYYNYKLILFKNE